MGFLRRQKEPEVVLDLREPEVQGAPSRPAWGSPVPCPSCSGRGYLDHIDPFREIMYLHCLECSTKYEVTRAQLEPDAASSI